MKEESLQYLRNHILLLFNASPTPREHTVALQPHFCHLKLPLVAGVRWDSEHMEPYILSHTACDGERSL